MAKKRQHRNNVIRPRFRQFKPNVGSMIFILIAVYIVFSLSAYAKRDKVRFYEVEEGSIVRENTYSGLILREETVYNAEASGYLNYYIPDGRKTAKGAAVYSIDETGSLNRYLTENPDALNSLSDTNIMQLRTLLQNAQNQYSNENFRSLYDTNSSLKAQVMEYASLNTLSAMSDQLSSLGIVFNSYQAVESGLVSYAVDGMENLTSAELTTTLFDKNAYGRTITKAGEMVEKGTPVYKLITSDSWEIAFPLSKTDITDFSDKKKLRIRFPDIGVTTTADFEEVRGADGADYGILSMKRYLVQFCSVRFVDFEIVTNDVSGLKIPEKSITQKDFYVVPTEYLVNLDGTEGFLRETVSETGTAKEFVEAELYNRDEEYCYLDTSADAVLQAGDYLGREDSSDRYQIGLTKPLEGVYNINKGYAVFKRIEPLEASNGYCIVKKGTSYGLSVYDHIVLDAETVNDGDLVYR